MNRLTLSLGFVLSFVSMGVPPILFAGEDSPQKSNRPNVLLLVTDDQRPDTIRLLGNRFIDTPNLDRLVRQGTTFTRAISPYPLCVPSRVEILTGCSEFRNRVLSRKLRRDSPFWPQTMRNAGYQTWYIGKWDTPGFRPSHIGYEEAHALFAAGPEPAPKEVDHKGRPITGYPGYVFQTDDGKLFPEKGVGLTANISQRFADAAVQLIRRKPNRPFFLHVNFTAPHDPLIMPPGYQDKYGPKTIPLSPNFLPRHPFDFGLETGRDEKLWSFPRQPGEVREDLATYYAIISHLDEQVGGILAALQVTGQMENTIVIFTSDHGLAIGSHGLRGKQNMYEHTVNVPLIMTGPGIPKGRRCNAQLYLRDLFPTVCELADVPIPKTVEGRSGLRVVKGEEQVLHQEVYGYFADTQRMVRTDRWKLIHYPKLTKSQLFDLAIDPHEMNDLAGDRRKKETLAELHRQLAAWQDKIGDSGSSGARIQSK